jgi:hypothetical protein
MDLRGRVSQAGGVGIDGVFGAGGSGRCSRCGWPESEPFEVVSRHCTSEGVIVYARCACGRLQVWRGAAVVLRGGPAC